MTRIALYLITAYLLAGWLYPAKAKSSVLGETPQPDQKTGERMCPREAQFPESAGCFDDGLRLSSPRALLHLGTWSIIRFVAEPSVMSLLARTLNWFIEHFTAKE